MSAYSEGKIYQSALVRVRWPSLTLIILLAASLIYLGNVYRQQNAILDDAYITFHFAEHLANGQGLVWNIGGERVEGFTSLLHVALLAVAIKAGIDPQPASMAIGIGSVLGTILLIVLILQREFGMLYPPAALTIGIYLIDQTTAFHTISGLETHLFVLFLCLSYALALAWLRLPDWPMAIGMALAIFFSLLCRPEGLLYGGALYIVLFAYTGWLMRRKRQGVGLLALSLLLSVILLATLGGAYAAWKYWYFGYLLPNSFYVKSNQLGLHGLREVVDYLKDVVTWVSPLLIGFVFTISPAIFITSFRTPERVAKIMLTLLPLSMALLYYSTIIHEVGGAHRFSYPTYFYIIIAVAAFFSVAMKMIPSAQSNPLKAMAVTLICCAVLVTSHEAWKMINSPWQPNPPDGFQQYHWRIAQALQATGLAGQATVLCDAAGVIPFVSHFNELDLVGLTDNVLSGRTPLTPAEREAYLWSRKVDVYIGYEPPASPGVSRLEDDPRMQSAYVNSLMAPSRFALVGDRVFLREPDLLYHRMVELRDNWYWVGEIEWPGGPAWGLKSFVYVRKDSPYTEKLTSALKQIVTTQPAHITLD